MQIVTASDAIVLIRKANNQQFDLIVFEWELPKLTGLEVLNAIRTSLNKETMVFIFSGRPVELPKDVAASKKVKFLGQVLDVNKLFLEYGKSLTQVTLFTAVSLGMNPFKVK